MKKELVSFDEWCEVESLMDYVKKIKEEAKAYFLNGAPKMDGEVEANMYVSSNSFDSDSVEDTVDAYTLEAFISDALEELEEDILDSLLSSGFIMLSIGGDENEFNACKSLYEWYEDEMLGEGYSLEEIEEAN